MKYDELIIKFPVKMKRGKYQTANARRVSECRTDVSSLTGPNECPEQFIWGKTYTVAHPWEILEC